MRAHTSSMLGGSSEVDVESACCCQLFPAFVNNNNHYFQAECFLGWTADLEAAVVVGKRKIQKTTTTTSKLSQGLGKCFKGCVVVVVHQLQDDDKRRLGRGVEAFGLALDLLVEVWAIVWATIFRCAFWWCCCVWFDA